ncbi:1-phosphofructokinase family hexose kinase [Marinisporobacter balticus]|uniref:Tagatose-6-phosphate kinase n=1 Tax=Marinisporobacter balticus TaxID=2018667 RepID=A0A4R2KIH5_9FIRM|nr:1-phosphofructokinase family hexose kinase [Marinisporobacter balticus]TCO73671.1 tagatose 6-phosphate kinase [Marinisporobacter balticus]
MITTVTLNPAIDRAYVINDFKPNKKYHIHVDDVKITAGGKGLNVARVTSILGEKVNATGFLGGYSGKFIEEELEKLDIYTSFVQINESSRIFTAIVDPLNNTETIVAEKGPVVTKKELNAFVKEFIKILKYSEIIVAAGSVPKGLPKTIYGDMVKIAKDNNVRMIIDVRGNYLEEAIKAKPFMIKPNLEELEELVGYKLDSDYKIIFECKHICKQGIDVVGISLGDEGAIFVTKEGAYKVCAPKAAAINSVGCGDAFVAGFAVSIYRENNLEEAFKMAVAAGTANVIEDRIGYVNLEWVEKFYKEIKVMRLE